MAELLDLVVGAIRHRRGATFQGRVCAAERCANRAVAGLDVLAIDVHGRRRVNWLVDGNVLAQKGGRGCGCGPGDSSFGIAFADLVPLQRRSWRLRGAIFVWPSHYNCWGNIGNENAPFKFARLPHEVIRIVSRASCWR